MLITGDSFGHWKIGDAFGNWNTGDAFGSWNTVDAFGNCKKVIILFQGIDIIYIIALTYTKVYRINEQNAK